MILPLPVLGTRRGLAIWRRDDICLVRKAATRWTHTNRDRSVRRTGSRRCSPVSCAHAARRRPQLRLQGLTLIASTRLKTPTTQSPELTHWSCRQT